MITDELKVILANHIEAALTVQGYHWNCEGPDFNQFHEFFGHIYSEYQSQVDTIAEYIRIVSDGHEYVNASVDIVRLNTTIKSNPLIGNKSKEMCAQIDIINDTLIDNFSELFKQATKENLQGLVNYCADRIDVLMKFHWKLAALTK